MKIKHSFLTSCIIALSLFTMANTAIAKNVSNYKGYKVFNCQSANVVRDYCGKNKGDLDKVLQSAKNLKSPNFDKDKKLVQLFFKGNARGIDYPYTTSKYAKPMTDFFVVDEKRKEIHHMGLTAGFDPDSPYLDKSPYAPKVITKRNSSWFCMTQDGAGFESFYEGDDIIIFDTANEWAKNKVCMKFVAGKQYSPTVITGDFDETEKITYPY